MTIEWIDELIDYLKEIDWFQRNAIGRRNILDPSSPAARHIADMDILIDSGCDKICFISNCDNDWVVKVDAHIPNKSDKTYTDRCGIEAAAYEDACAKGLGAYFAKTLLYCVIDGTQIFIQEYAAPNEDETRDIFCDYCKIGYDRDTFETDEEYEDAAASAMEYMDEEDEVHAMLGEDDDIDRLVAFIDDHNIGDLHSLNWGYTPDGRVVMIDFCGYTWEAAYREMGWVCESRYCQV